MAVHLANFLAMSTRDPSRKSPNSSQNATRSFWERRSVPSLPGAGLFVVTRAVTVVIRAAFEERSQLPGTIELKDELL
jgi:hypothetical protein